MDIKATIRNLTNDTDPEIIDTIDDKGQVIYPNGDAKKLDAGIHEVVMTHELGPSLTFYAGVDDRCICYGTSAEATQRSLEVSSLLGLSYLRDGASENPDLTKAIKKFVQKIDEVEASAIAPVLQPAGPA